MLLKQPLRELDPSRLLDLVPVPNAAVRSEERNGVLVLWVPLHRRWWTQAPFSWVFPFREEKGIELDAIGREVWAEYDGRRTLEQIIDGFAARHRVRFHEARVSVVQFSSSLFERRLITVRAPEDAVSEGKQNPRRRKKRKGSAP